MLFKPDLTITSSISNPYKGLFAFKEKDADFFFGRRRHIEKLIGLLEDNPLITVTGPSGIGKTSLIRAGLIPNLKNNGLWHVASFNAGRNPFNSLCAAICKIIEQDRNNIPGLIEKFENNPFSMIRKIESFLNNNKDSRLLVFGDQLEDIVTICHDDKDRHKFLSGIISLAEHGDLHIKNRIKIILAIDIHYLGKALLLEQISPVFDYPDLKLGLMNKKELKNAIEMPAKKNGVKFEKGLVKRILEDMDNNGQQLGFFQFAMWKLWENQDNGLLTHIGYEKTGGVNQAIAVHCENFFNGLEPDKKKKAEKILTGLFIDHTRQETILKTLTLSYADKDKRKMASLMEKEHILTSKQERGDKTIRPVHKILIEGWPRLKEMVSHRAYLQKSYKEAEKKRKSAISRYLAAQSLLVMDKEFDLSLLLSVEACRISDTVDAKSALLRCILHNPRLKTHLKGHKGGVYRLFFTEQGNILISGGWDNSIILWDIKGQKPSALPITGSSMTISPDGRIMALSRGDNAIILRDIKSCEALGKPLSGHTDTIYGMDFSPDGSVLASGGSDGKIFLWDINNMLPMGGPLLKHNDVVSIVKFSPDGSILASGSWDGTIFLWDVKKRKAIGQIFNNDFIFSLAFNPWDETMVSGTQDGSMVLWDLITQEPVSEPLKKHKGPVFCLAFSPDGKILASSGDDGSVILWDTDNWNPVADPFLGHNNPVVSVCFHPGGNTIASGDSGGNIIIWKTDGRHCIFRKIPGINPCFHPEKKIIAIAGADNSISFYDVENKKFMDSPMHGHDYFIFNLAFSSDGKILASGSGDNTIILWDFITQKPLCPPLSGHEDSVYSVSFSPDGTILASGGGDGKIIFWDMKSKKASGEPILGHKGPVHSVAFSPDGKILASGSGDNSIILWDAFKKQIIGLPLSGHNNSVQSISFSPDGKILASGSRDNKIILWDVKLQKPVGKPLMGHKDTVFCVRFSPDGKILASGSYDNSVLLWDMATQRQIGPPLEGHTNNIAGVSFSRDGRYLAVGGRDNLVILWDIDQASWKRHACMIANRNMTMDEWNHFMDDEPYINTCPFFPGPYDGIQF